MADAPFDVARVNRWFAVETNNMAWELVEAKTRSAADVENMIDAAHAACFHWKHVGNSLNYLRAQTLLVTAYVRSGRAEPARYHADRCLRASDTLGDEQTRWDRACTYACVAEALEVAGGAGHATAFGGRAVVAAEDLRADAAQIAETFDDAGDIAQFAALFGQPH